MLALKSFYSSLVNDSRMITICVVYLSLFLDNVLLTMIVPIMPDFLINNDMPKIKLTSETFLGEKSSNLTQPTVKESSLTVAFDPSFENGRVSLLLSSKALVQLILNPVIGIMTSRVGYPLLLFLGTCVLLVSAMVFAFGTGYLALFFARSFQGVASSCIGITGMCLVAEKYPNEPDRSKMMGLVLGSVAAGVLIGYPFGGFMYDSLGKTAPFIITVLFVCLDGALQLYFSDLKPAHEKPFPTVGWVQLFTDKRILLTGGAIGISTSTIAILEPCLPIWLLQEIKPKKWQLGTAFIPDSLGYFVGTNSVALIAFQKRRSKIVLPAMVLVGLSASLLVVILMGVVDFMQVPAAKTMLQLVIPHFLLGFGIGAVDAALVPLLAALVDSKYLTHYGTVYAMQQISVSLAYFVGPVLGSGLAKSVGFPCMMRIVGAVNILYCPLILLLDRFMIEEFSEEKQSITDYSGSKQINYQEFSESEESE